MKITKKQINVFLFLTQSIAAIFGAIFLTTYFGGLPSTATLNSEPVFLISQSIIATILIAFILVALFIAVINRKTATE